MDFSLNDVPNSDPFLSLDTDLDDVSEVIRSNWTLEPYPAEVQFQPFPAHRLPTGPPTGTSWAESQIGSVEDRLFQALPEQEKNLEIGSIVTLLQQEDTHYQQNQQQSGSHYQAMEIQVPSDGTHLDAQRAAAGFSPNGFVFHQQQQAVKPSTRFTFGQASTVQSLLQKPVGAANNFSSIQMQPPLMMSSPSAFLNNEPRVCKPSNVKTEIIDIPDQSPTKEPMDERTNSSSTTKEDLLRLLVKMSPTEVDRLVKGDREKPEKESTSHKASVSSSSGRRSTNVGVATKMSHGDVLSDHSRLNARRVAAAAAATESSALSGESDTETDTAMTPGGGRRSGKPERRTAHNLIEKKYRCSINDRINHLKIMLTGEDAKLSKSATLRKAIDYIHFLQTQNEQLNARNEQLKRALLARGVEVPDSPVAVESHNMNVQSPADSSNPSSPGARDSPSPKPRSKRARPMHDRSRVTLLALLLCMVVWNPFSLLLGASSASSLVAARADTPLDPSSQMPGRTLQSTDPDAFEGVDDGRDENKPQTISAPSVNEKGRPPKNELAADTLLRSLCVWALNLIVIACVLTRLLIYGEPITDSDSFSGSQFRRHKTLAEQEIAKGNLCEAQRQFYKCLEALNRPLPAPGIDELFALLWQTFRHLLNMVWIGRWLSQRKRSGIKLVSVSRWHAETALIYHRLHQLHLMGLSTLGDGLSGLGLSLSAVNLAEAAGSALSHRALVDIYIHAALRARTTLPGFFGSTLQMYFLKRAQRRPKQGDYGAIISTNGWLFHPAGRRFISDEKTLAMGLSFKNTQGFPFCTVQRNAHPMEHLTAAFKLHLLNKMLNTVLSRADDADESAQLNPVEFMDVSHLLLDMCRPVECSPDELIESDQAVGSLNQGDELCAWWTHLLTCAVHWAAGEKAKAKQRYTFVRTCPKALLADNLALALGNAFCCRKLCTDDQNNKKYQSFVWVHCTKAQRALRQLDSKSSGPRAALTESVKLLAYDWMLGSLSDVWQDQIVASRPYWTQPAAAPLAELYYQTLEDYRLMAQDRESTFCKLALFEAAGRMLTGANPIPTWQSLLRCSRMCRDGSGRVVVTSDRRRIDALLQLHDSIARP